MTAYYNENDPYCVQWLRNLIAKGLIADGLVDDRSIADVAPIDLKGFTQCHFFAGIGGWSGALRLAAFSDHRPVWTGSCPCQPFSLAGKKSGFADERHLWPYWHYLIEQCRPAIVLGEQVASASQWLRLVRGDLEALGYAFGAMPVEAASAGADHLRDRYWFVGYSSSSTRLEVGPVAVEQRGVVRQERPSVAAPGDRGDPMAHAFDLPVRNEPRRRDGANGTGAGVDCDDSKNDMADANSATWGRQAGHAQPGTGVVQAAGRPEQSRGRDGNFEWVIGDDSEGSLSYAASEQARSAGHPRQHSGLEWVIGADGKARRVKSGIRLLAHGVPCRVAKLRALGNAIDLRPAAAFIKAVMEAAA